MVVLGAGWTVEAQPQRFQRKNISGEIFLTVYMNIYFVKLTHNKISKYQKQASEQMSHWAVENGPTLDPPLLKSRPLLDP